MNFDDLGLSPEIVKAVADVGYTTPTPIQEQAIPPVLMGRDVLGIAQTGTGKTAGFTLPMVHILASGRARARMPRSLILVPTRELAHQVADNFALYSKYHRLSMALLIGGESFVDQGKALARGVDVLIATPGRLKDLFERGSIILHDVKILVIDEADRMMDMGFIPDVTQIVSFLPKNRQTLFFSATMNDDIRHLADSFLREPHEIRVSPRASAADTVEQKAVRVPTQNSKRRVLRHLLSTQDVRSAFIFCNRKRDVSLLFYSLERHGFQPVHLHGDMTQPQRLAALATFKEGRSTIMVCSDVAARGIDVSEVSHVFNFDIPFHAEDYVHRIGRTGRAGRDGAAWSLVTEDDEKQVAAIEGLIGRAIPVIELDMPKLADAPETPPVAENAGTSESGVPKHPGRRPVGPQLGGRNRRGRGMHPSDLVPEVDHPDGALAFGGITPAFLLAPLTREEERALLGLPALVAPPVSDDLSDDSATEGEADVPVPASRGAPPRSSRSRSPFRRRPSADAVVIDIKAGEDAAERSTFPEEGTPAAPDLESGAEVAVQDSPAPEKGRPRRSAGRRKKKVVAANDDVGEGAAEVSALDSTNSEPSKAVEPASDEGGGGGPTEAVGAATATGEDSPKPQRARRRAAPRRRSVKKSTDATAPSEGAASDGDGSPEVNE